MQWGTQGDVAYICGDAHAAGVGTDRRRGAGRACHRCGRRVEAAETTEIAGPREERLVEAARLLAARRGDGLRVEETSDPSDPDSELYANGAALPGPDAKLAGPTFEEWLDATVPAGRA